MKHARLIVALVLSVFLAAGIGWYIDLRQYASSPLDTAAPSKVFQVKTGQGLNQIALGLADQELISSPLRFKMMARFRGQETSIKAGEYELTAAMTPAAILENLVSGKVRLHRITFPEGYRAIQIAELASRSGFGTKAEWVNACRNKKLLTALSVDADSCEGYLFPDTYLLPANTDAENVIRAMVARFWEVFTDEWKKRAEEIGFSVHETVTLASIIEKETGAGFERPLISSVFHNRLKKKMRLQTDPTVIYGIKDFNGDLTRKDLRTPTPYNTYVIRGLPPGPIASPGAKAIEAALYPADTKYLYFVSKKDTTHQFSTNIRDHNAAVRKYQLRR